MSPIDTARHSARMNRTDPAADAIAESIPVMPRVNIGSIDIDIYSQVALVDEVLCHALYGNQTRQVVTANAQFYVLAEKSRRFRDCLREAHYICADGMPIVWVCNTFTDGLVPRIAGVDLIEKICRFGARHGLRIFLLGGRPEAADMTAKVLVEKYPGIQIAGVNCPLYNFERREETLRPVLDHIAEARPHVLFVGLGAPKQEFFIHHHVKPLCVPLAVGIGGSFEILSGKLNRAPMWVQSSGFEWAYRLAHEPRRLWRRYLIGNIEFLLSVIRWTLRRPAARGLQKPMPQRAATP